MLGKLEKKAYNHLYEKYSSSQNYYYTRDVNEILFKQEGTRALILFKDFAQFDNADGEEFFQELYGRAVYLKKITYLTEYYKFHNDIPRLFMEPVNHTLNYYHDKQRRIKYVKITRMLQEQQKLKEEQLQQQQQQQQPST